MEIERKYLVPQAPDDVDTHPSTVVEQGYLAIHDDGTEVRIRRRDGVSTMTVKSSGGRTRAEEELELDDATFERLWPFTEGRRIEKVRHVIPTDTPGVEIELDTYGGDLDGLVVAEVEFPARPRPMRSRRPRGSAARSPTTSASRTSAWPCTGARTRRSPGCPAHRRSPTPACRSPTRCARRTSTARSAR